MDLNIPTLESFGQIVTCTIEGILEPEDLRELVEPEQQEGEPSTPRVPPQALEDPSNLQRLRERHHSVARLLARGMTQSLVARITGYTDSYLSILLNSPAMTELIEMYRIQAGSAVEVVTEKLKTVGLKALDKIEEKLDADTKNVTSLSDLKEIAKLGLDRGGHGPQSKHVVDSEHHIYDHASLQELNRSARERNSARIVSPETVRQALPAPSKDESPADGAEP